MSWLVELHFGDMSTGGVFWTFVNGGEDLVWRLVERCVISGLLWWCFIWVQALARSSRWHHRVVFELRTWRAPNVEINSWIGAKVRKTRGTIVNNNNCSSGVPSMCT
jgi:hypothetical protein